MCENEILALSEVPWEPQNEHVFSSCWNCRTANTIRHITEIKNTPLADRQRRSAFIPSYKSILCIII